MKLKRKIKHIKNYNKEIPAGACYLEQQKKKKSKKQSNVLSSVFNKIWKRYLMRCTSTIILYIHRIYAVH